LPHPLHHQTPRPARRPVTVVLLLALVAVALYGCAEDLESTAACPALCPRQNLEVRDTFFAVTLDSTVEGFPTRGTEPFLWVASRGDTVETRAVIRFDTLPAHYGGVAATDTGTAITEVDSALLRLHLDTLRSLLPESITIDVYDVDTTAADADTAALGALFRDDRLIGGVTVARAGLTDSLLVPLQNAVLLNKAAEGKRLRVGLRVRGSSGAELRIFSTEGGSGTTLGPRLTFRPSPDTAVRALSVVPRSLTPVDRFDLQSELRDFIVAITGTPGAVPGSLAVGGLSARRAYLRFDVSPTLLRQWTVVRATLLLTQRPNAGATARDTFYVYPQVVLAGSAVTDLARAASLLGPKPGTFVGTGLSPLAADSVRIAAADSGVRSVELVRLVTQWRNRADTLAPRAIVLRSDREGMAAIEALFHSTDAAPELHPQLRVSYVPGINFGLP
jgi:hypothetical protein